MFNSIRLEPTTSPATDAKQVIIVTLGSMLILSISYLLFIKSITPVPEPRPKIGLDAATMNLKGIWTEKYLELYSEALQYDNMTTREVIRFWRKVTKFQVEFEQFFKDKPEENHVIDALNRLWKTNFESFDEISKFFESLLN